MPCIQLDTIYSSSGPVSSPSLTETSEPSSDLESSLIHLINDHHNASLNLHNQTERAKKIACKNALRVSNLLVEAVNSGVQEAFVNEKRIEAEIRALSATIVLFGKQTEQWLESSRSINNVVKEIGDFENWMKVMEFDCKSITAAISNIHNG